MSSRDPSPRNAGRFVFGCLAKHVPRRSHAYLDVAFHLQRDQRFAQPRDDSDELLREIHAQGKALARRVCATLDHAQ